MTTREKITSLEQRIEALEQRIFEERQTYGEADVDLEIDLSELKEQLNFAWQDDESEYDYAVDCQMFNADGSLMYY